MAGRFDRICESVIGEGMYNYKTEFGEHGYTVPQWVLELVKLGVLYDSSWHNDAAPSFNTNDDDIRLWVDHRDPEQREMKNHHRFGVVLNSEDEVMYDGDDPVEAIQSILQSDYDESDGTFYVRELGDGKPIKKFKTEGEAMKWIAELPRKYGKEV